MSSQHYFLPQWPSNLAATACKLYKNFLWLHCKYSDVLLVPTKDIDEVWHNHILFTKQYHADCEALFGRYLHHHPSDRDNEAEINKLVEPFQTTKALYLQEFGEPLAVLERVSFPQTRL